MKTTRSAALVSSLALATTLFIGAGCGSAHVAPALAEKPAGNELGQTARIEAPRAVKVVAPVYPPQARKDGLEDIVMLRCVIDVAGNVQDVRPERRSDMALEDAAIAAVRQWKFTPGTRDGTPEAMTVILPINFSFDRGENSASASAIAEVSKKQR